MTGGSGAYPVVRSGPGRRSAAVRARSSARRDGEAAPNYTDERLSPAAEANVRRLIDLKKERYRATPSAHLNVMPVRQRLLIEILVRSEGTCRLMRSIFATSAAEKDVPVPSQQSVLNDENDT